SSPSGVLREIFPGSYSSYLNSRQGQNKIPTYTLGLIGNVVVTASFAIGVLLTVGYWRRGQWVPVVLFVTIVLALLGNAFLTGALSGVFDRYQSRLVWLLVFYATAGLLWRNADRAGTHQEVKHQ
ncbi:MAG: hypothetical protein ACTSX7_16495, partial [Alphaproteobacteria bacterium]